MSERKQTQKFHSSKLIHKAQLLPSVKTDDGKEERNWFLDRKHYKDRNKKLIQLYAEWEECFKVGKFNYTLISNLRYWSVVPNRKSIELAISDEYRDTTKSRETYDDELR